jgi:NitT/TauT family transport system permease protein
MTTPGRGGAPPDTPAGPDRSGAPVAVPGWRARIGRLALPMVALALGCLVWELAVWGFAVPPYVLPPPSTVAATLWSDRALLLDSLVATLTTTAQGFGLAVVGGAGLAILFSQSRLLEGALYPYAVILQVTPVVAVAPLLLIWLPQPLAVLACAWIVAFFPMLANTTLGLRSVDHNLLDLFALYGASRWQRLLRLQLPAALPTMLAGARIAGGLSLIGAVVAEIAAGSAGAGAGLAYRIAESGYRLNVPRMFAALLLLSLAGIAVHAALSLVSWLILRRWHESALPGRA